MLTWTSQKVTQATGIRQELDVDLWLAIETTDPIWERTFAWLQPGLSER